MANLAQLEATFQRYVADLERWVPDGIVDVDIDLLQRLDLLSALDGDDEEDQQRLAQYFHVIESPDKITLFNDDFAIWIVPEIHDSHPVTYGMIALRYDDGIELEMVFSATGVYNTSRTMLRVLDRLLQEIRETEQELLRLGETS